ncbi:hypothetical protein Trydic_g5672 [Trypoxylus dichotomus]
MYLNKIASGLNKLDRDCTCSCRGVCAGSVALIPAVMLARVNMFLASCDLQQSGLRSRSRHRREDDETKVTRGQKSEKTYSHHMSVRTS